MANIHPRGDKHQVTIKNKLLPKPFYFTFDTVGEAETYAAHLELLLQRGIVPQELLEAGATRGSPLTTKVIDDYLEFGPAVTSSDAELLPTVAKDVVGTRVRDLTYSWVQAYVRRLKLVNNLSPGTIRKRVGALGRVIDWHLLDTNGDKSTNALRMLPVGYSSYTAEEKRKLPPKATAKVDEHRDRRLLPAEEARIRAALQGGKRDDRERAWGPDADMELLFDLVVDTGLRLKEAYTLRSDQIDLDARVIRVEGSKGHRGKLKPRTVPLKPVLVAKLAQRPPAGKKLVFPFWDGSEEDLRGCGHRLSNRFRTLFAYAEVDDLSEHDLRHEATCRWILLRGADRHWVFSDTEVCRIMGWSNYSMILRYASLRGEDLASRLM